MDKVNEFFVKNMTELEKTSSVPAVEEIAIKLAEEQNVPEVIELSKQHLLISKLTGFFGWCNATEESMDYAIECMKNTIPKLPDYGYKPKLDDFAVRLSFAVQDGNEAIIHMPHATWMDLCKHFYNEIYN